MENNNSHQTDGLKRGVITFIALAVLTVIEYVVGVLAPGDLYCGCSRWSRPAWSCGTSCTCRGCFVGWRPLMSTQAAPLKKKGDGSADHSAHASAAHAHGVHDYAQKLANNRLGLWLFIISDSFVFGGLLVARFYLLGDTARTSSSGWAWSSPRCCWSARASL
jgi:hypothetical protein